MAVIQTSRDRGTMVKEYQCLSTDAESSYPTSAMCCAGSTMIIIDSTNKVVAGYKYFDGTTWNTI